MLAFVRTFDMIYIANSVLNSYTYMYQRKKQRYFKVFVEDREAVTPGKKFPRRKVEKYFRKLQKNGTELYVDGEKVSPSQAAAYAVREESQYMADYILGEQGKISQVRLDKVVLR